MYDIKKNIENSPKLWAKETSTNYTAVTKIYKIKCDHLILSFKLVISFKQVLSVAVNNHKIRLIKLVLFSKYSFRKCTSSPFKQKPSKLKAVLKERFIEPIC